LPIGQFVKKLNHVSLVQFSKAKRRRVGLRALS